MVTTFNDVERLSPATENALQAEYEALTTYTDPYLAVRDKLAEPFPVEDIQWLPKAKRGFAFVDVWSYKDRLDLLVPGMWTEKQPVIVVGPNKVFVSVEITLFGRPYGGLGEEDLSNDNAATVAYSQAFRRACASFGMGRYMYDFGTTWLDEATAKQIAQEKQSGQNITGLRLAVAAYRKLGIPLDEKYANLKPAPTAAAPTNGNTTRGDNTRAAPADDRPATPSTPTVAGGGYAKGERVGSFSGPQVYRLSQAGFTDTEIRSGLIQSNARRVTDMVIGSRMSKDAVLSTLNEEEDF